MTLDSTEILRGSSTSSSQKINTSAMLPEDEVLFMDKFNNTITDYSWQKTIVELFEQQVLKTPEDNFPGITKQCCSIRMPRSLPGCCKMH
jgi:hypothetical protein